MTIIKTKEDVFETLGKKIADKLIPHYQSLAIIWLKYIEDNTLFFTIINTKGKTREMKSSVSIDSLYLTSDEAFDIKYQNISIYFSKSSEIQLEIQQIIKNYKSKNRSISERLRHKYSLEENKNRDWNKRIENVLIACKKLKEDEIIKSYQFNKNESTPEIIIKDSTGHLVYVFGVNYAYCVSPNNQAVELFELISAKDSIKTTVDKLNNISKIPSWVTQLTYCYDLRRK